MDSKSFCGQGTTVPAGPTFACYGSGIGVSVAQATDGGDAGGVTSLAPAGLTWAVSVVPAFGLRLIVTAPSGPCVGPNGCCYDPPVGATSGVAPWSAFTTTCYDAGDAGAGFNPAAGLTQLNFAAISSQASGENWAFCVTTLSY